MEHYRLDTETGGLEIDSKALITMQNLLLWVGLGFMLSIIVLAFISTQTRELDPYIHAFFKSVGL